jgi:putative cardiolipin synthase
MKRVLKGVATLIALAVVWVVVARVVFPLPDIAQRPPEHALPANAQTALGALAQQGQDAHPGQSGVLPLESGQDALASRLSLIDQAEASVDVQYYIWHDDMSGILLLDALDRAAGGAGASAAR